MPNKIDGVCFKNMVDFAVRNLNKHVKTVNKLNVFPVPDGDTGTNMVTTIHKGLLSVDDSVRDLSSVSKKFAHSIVFEARGNSGVIVSQFLKGISEKFYDVDVADPALFIEALEKGVQYAYSSVATPVEGTMLTVMKDATNAVKKEFTQDQTINQVIDSFVKHAKVSLEHTPELLSVLKETGVVDSGGAGIVYLFEGMKMYLDGDSIDELNEESKLEKLDYDSFNSDSTFEYGYCTELLLQLLNSKEKFEHDYFKNELLKLGNSLVVLFEKDKVRIHIHTHFPEKVFAFCHQYGEFLSSKIENMTVQHTEQDKRILVSNAKNDGCYSVVAVANDKNTQELFLDMGADIVIRCEDNISTKDFIDAFEKSNLDNIIVFPNSSDAILAAMQAKKLYKQAKVNVINSKNIAECYSALPTIDFSEENLSVVCDSIAEIITNTYVVSVAKRDNEILYNNKKINKDEYFSYSGKKVIAISKTLTDTVINSITKIVNEYDKEIITIFYKNTFNKEQIDEIVNLAKEQGIFAEFFSIPTESIVCDLIISFE